MIRNIVIAMALSVGSFAFVASSYAADPAPAPKKEEMKCDKDGKSCKDGENCKKENCKVEKK